MRACRRMGAMMLLALSVAGSPARANAAPEHIRLQFSAPPNCAKNATFIRALRQRTGRFRLANGDERTRVFVVNITQANASVSGRLEIQGPQAETSMRSVSGKTCDEVVAALALMTALAIDPSALVPSTSVPKVSAPGALASHSPAPTSSGPGAALPEDSSSRATKSPAPLDSLTAPRATDETASPTSPRRDSRLRIATSKDAPPRTPVELGAMATPTSLPASAPWKWAAGAQGGVSSGLSPTTGWALCSSSRQQHLVRRCLVRCCARDCF